MPTDLTKIADELDDLIQRAYRQAVEDCIAATRDVCDIYDWDDERPFDAVIERLEALKGGK